MLRFCFNQIVLCDPPLSCRCGLTPVKLLVEVDANCKIVDRGDSNSVGSEAGNKVLSGAGNTVCGEGITVVELLCIDFI